MSKLRVEQKVDEDLEHQQLQQHLTKQQQQQHHVHHQQQQHAVVLPGQPKSYVDILQQSLAREQQRLAEEEKVKKQAQLVEQQQKQEKQQKQKQDKPQQDKQEQQKHRKQSIPSDTKASNHNQQQKQQHVVSSQQQQQQQQQRPKPQQITAPQQEQKQHKQHVAAHDQPQQEHHKQQQQQQQQPQQEYVHAYEQQTNDSHKAVATQFIFFEGSDFKQEKQEVFQYVLHQHNALHQIKLYILQLQAANDHFTKQCSHAVENNAKNHHGLAHFEQDKHHLLAEATLDEAMKPLALLLNQNAQHFQRVIALTNDPRQELKDECQHFFNTFLTNQYQLYELLHDIKKLEDRCQAWGQKALGVNIMKLTLTEMMARAANPQTHADQVWQPTANCSKSVSLKDHVNAVPFLPRQYFMQEEQEQQQVPTKHGVDSSNNHVVPPPPPPPLPLPQQHQQQQQRQKDQKDQQVNIVHPTASPPEPQRIQAKLPQPIKLPIEQSTPPPQFQQQSQEQKQHKPQQEQQKVQPQQQQQQQQKAQPQQQSFKSAHVDNTTNRRRSLADLVAENSQKKLTNHTPTSLNTSSITTHRDGQHTGIGGGTTSQRLATGVGAAGGTTYRRGSTASINSNREKDNNNNNNHHHVSFAPAIPSSVQQDSLVLKFRPGSASSTTSASSSSSAQSVGPDGLTRAQRRKQFWLSYLDKHPEKKDAMYHKNNDVAMSKTERGQLLEDKHRKEVEEKMARERAKKEALENRSVINGAYIQALPNGAVVTVNTDSVNGGNDYIDVDYLVL